ncbi:hypothetical protein [Halocalculus aciditolerans]|uniref:Uncharacterized protein n=1 Tax=Halocalculus aciditolerans TaxID=1383812 RepID=A0A830FDT3_9EURY|nr:hypothetical protein [Halocalculus aciditolerans]GGL65424.1 hypothetical protein GCM10009039_24100 [Halocalculus aciditolerans]
MLPGNPDVDTDVQPPMRLPLGHFVVALGALCVAVLVGLLRGDALFALAAGLAHVHLVLVGWVCLTIAGAMTQFVPVWSGVRLHSTRLAGVQLALLAVGLAGFAVALLVGAFAPLPAFAAAMLLGFWVFVYNIARTLARARPFDVTERHFAYALASFLAVSALGVSLAVGFTRPDFLPVSRVALRGSHVALALFGAVLCTVFGALYQLVPMFAQSDLDALDRRLQRLEETVYPLGVAVLATGRLVEIAPLARLGGLLVVGGVLAVAVVLARRLADATVSWGPMLRRYAVLPVAMGAWAAWTLPVWLARPLAYDAAVGAPGSFSLLVLGVVGFVVLGTLYHVVPFIVWVHRYSDRLGFEAVPTIDDLYVARVAHVDFALLLAGTALLVLVTGGVALPAPLARAGDALVAGGVALAAANLLLVVCRHAVAPAVSARFGSFASE